MDIKLSMPSVRDFKIDNNSQNVEITIDNSICTRYSGITISNIEVKDSPDWLASRLRTIGIKPINNIVDITNYLMFENQLHNLLNHQIQLAYINIHNMNYQ